MLPTLWHAVSLDHGLTIVTDCYLVHLVLFLLLSSVCRTTLLVWSYGTRLKCVVLPRTCVSFIGFQSETEYLSKLPHCAITLHSHQPVYLASIISEYKPARTLRSSSQDLLAQPPSTTVTAARRFSCCAPRVWNALPISIRKADSITSFKARLKTHYFQSAFGPNS